MNAMRYKTKQPHKPNIAQPEQDDRPEQQCFNVQYGGIQLAGPDRVIVIVDGVSIGLQGRALAVQQKARGQVE